MDDNIRKQIGQFKFDLGLTNEDMAREMLMCKSTFERRVACPSRFSLEEIRMMAIIFDKHGKRFDLTFGEGAAAC